MTAAAQGANPDAAPIVIGNARVQLMRSPTAPHGTATFDRIMVGVDSTTESRTAVEQAASIATPRTTLILANVFPLGLVDEAALASGDVWQEEASVADELLSEARARVVAATDAGEIQTRVAPGPAKTGLRDLLGSVSATMVCVGIHGSSRLRGTLAGSVASWLVHAAPCSVLIARTAGRVDRFPRRMTCAVDGSEAAAAAIEVAESIAARDTSELRYLVAGSPETASVERARISLPPGAELEVEEGEPLEVLLDRSRSTDLLVVGGQLRRAHRTLTSVGERLAHRASCSVLIVR